MKKRILLTAALIICLTMTGCAAAKEAEQPTTVSQSAVAETGSEINEQESSSTANETGMEIQADVPEDGVYSAIFDTDSSMFKVNETKDGRGILTVEDGRMTIHISLMSKKILNLFPGTADKAQEPGAVLLEPTVDEVTYEDGYTEEVYGFDIPVPYLDDEFDCALIGEKGKWYDHKVSVSDVVPLEEETENGKETTAAISDPVEGLMYADVALEGGSGKAYIESPCIITGVEGAYTAVITWSSPYYDYMIVDGETYYPVNESGNSVFEIPVTYLDEPLNVQADTTAMSTPHLIDYTIVFSNVVFEN